MCERTKGRTGRAGFTHGLATGSGALVAGAVLLTAALTLALGPTAPDGPAPRPAAPGVTDTIPDADLRCLTRRPEDCLDEPVPADEPHEALCATCHDLWRQDASTVRSCTDVGCHTEPTELSPFHRTVETRILAECTGCHRAHDFRVPEGGERCSVCHTGGGDLPARLPEPARHLPDLPDFGHRDHTAVACTDCHGTRTTHTDLRVRTVEDCRSCHHVPADEVDCLACHRLDEVTAIAFPVERALDIRVGALDRPVRTLPFEHRVHWSNGCTACHTGGTALGTAQGADCSTCHFEHHQETADCSLCHAPPAPGAHDRDAHLGCAGTGCHDPLPPALDPVPRTREVCLACHIDLADHKPGRDCSFCHVLPTPR